MRIGVSVAKGLASAQKLPLIGVSTLDILVCCPGTGFAPALCPVCGWTQARGLCPVSLADEGWQAETGVNVADWTELAEQMVLPAIVLGELNAQGLEALRPYMGGLKSPRLPIICDGRVFWQTWPGCDCVPTRLMTLRLWFLYTRGNNG